MSTYHYYRCDDHNPPITSDDEFTQHTDDVYYRAGVELAKSRPVEPDDGGYWSMGKTYANEQERMLAYFGMNARKFLVNHPNCNLSIISEYGEVRPLE